jgi:hypothetical protein
MGQGYAARSRTESRAFNAVVQGIPRWTAYSKRAHAVAATRKASMADSMLANDGLHGGSHLLNRLAIATAMMGSRVDGRW